MLVSLASGLRFGRGVACLYGAKVTLYTTNNGDGTVDIKYDILAANGHKYHMGYTGISGVDPNDFFVKLSLEKAHLEFDTVIGNEDNTSAFFGALSNLFDVPAGKPFLLSSSTTQLVVLTGSTL